MPRFMTDEQRRAMFARLRGGGGNRTAPTSTSALPGGIAGPGETPSGISWRPVPEEPSDSSGSRGEPAANPSAQPQTRTPFIPPPVSKWDLFKAGVAGFFEGAKGGASILADTLSFGATDALGITKSDQYQGGDYDFSRGAAEVAKTALTTAAGIGAIDKLGKAYAGTKLASTAIGKLAAPLTAVGGFGTKSAIDDYRAENPTLDPGVDKALAMASELAGFIGAAGAFGTVAKGLGLIGKIPVSAKLGTGAHGKLQKAFASVADPTGAAALKTLSAGGRATVATVAKTGIVGADKALGFVGRAFKNVIGDTSNAILGKNITGGIAKALKAAHSGYSKFSNFTGSTLKEALAAPKAAGKLRSASKLTKQAAALRSSASSLKVAEGYKAMKLEAAAAKKLASAAKYTAAGRSAAANKAHREAIGLLWQADDVTRAAAKSAGKLTKDAAKLATRAAGFASEGKAGLAAAGYVGAIAGTMTYAEEKGLGKVGEKLGFGKGIQNYEKEAKAAFKAGEKFRLPSDAPRSAGATAAAIAVGTTGNPIEKWTRGSWAKEPAEMGAYRAKYELIGEARARGDITAAQADAAFKKLASQKPLKVAGRGVWDVAPAMGAYLKWKIGDQINEAKRSTIDVRPAGSYADADTLHVGRGTVRMSDMNAPEVAHGRGANQIERQTGEYLGEEAAARIRQLVKEGQYVRLVEDSNPKAGGLDKYGRAVRTVETLPKPFDQLLRVPYLGKVIPARDVNKTLIREGLADIHYRALSGKTDRAEAYDKAREAAKAEGRGIWSKEAQRAYADYAKANPSYTPWIGTEKTVEQARIDRYRATHGGAFPADKPATELGKILGLGLMTSGNSGIFGSMPQSGSAIAQGWNAVLAALGGLGYNEAARAAEARAAAPMREVPTDYARAMAALRAAQEARIAALNAQ
jgi:endonuclease YncB( thermonuclease family)